jgi:hypothetical protein
LRHPAVGALCLGVLYLIATVVMVVLACSASAWWPAVLAITMALVTVVCAVMAWRRF